MIKQTLDLNLIPGRVLPRVNVSQYDKGTRTLEFTIYNGEIRFNPTGYAAYIQGLKPDGHGFNYAADIEDQKISVDVVEQMTAVAGAVACEIVIKDGTDQIGTGNFILQVEAAALPDDATMSESDYNIIQQAVEDAQAAAEEAKEATANAPYIGENGNWYTYDADTKQYIDTGVGAEGPEGPEGPTGNGIASITKTGTVGLVDTYTITFTDGTTTTFTVTNGEDAVTTVEQDDSLALAPTSAGNALPLTIYGQSTQNGTPTPSAPVAIESASADFKCVGKNLLPVSSFITQTVNGITFTNNNDGTWGISGTNDGTNVSLKTIFVFDDKAEGMKVNCSSQHAYRIRYQVSQNDSTFIGEQLFSNSTVIVEFPSGSTYASIQLSVNKNVAITGTETVYTIMTLPDVTDFTYEPYKHTDITTSQTLRSIEVTSSDPYNLVKDGHYYIADTIDWNEVDGYQITRRVGTKTLNGSEGENWTASGTNTTGKYRMNYNDETIPTYRELGYSDAFHKGCVVSNQFPEATQGSEQPYNCNQTIATVLGSHVWQMYSTDYQDVASWKAHLIDEPLVVNYRLVTPTKTSLTSAQAKALLSMRTYDESTSIDAVNAPAPVLELEYAKEYYRSITNDRN